MPLTGLERGTPRSAVRALPDTPGASNATSYLMTTRPSQNMTVANNTPTCET